MITNKNLIIPLFIRASMFIRKDIMKHNRSEGSLCRALFMSFLLMQIKPFYQCYHDLNEYDDFQQEDSPHWSLVLKNLQMLKRQVNTENCSMCQEDVHVFDNSRLS